MKSRGGFLGGLLGKKKDADAEFATVRDDEAAKKDNRGSEVQIDVAGTDNEGDTKKGTIEGAPALVSAPAAAPVPSATAMSRMGNMFSRLTGGSPVKQSQINDKQSEPVKEDAVPKDKDKDDNSKGGGGGGGAGEHKDGGQDKPKNDNDAKDSPRDKNPIAGEELVLEGDKTKKGADKQLEGLPGTDGEKKGKNPPGESIEASKKPMPKPAGKPGKATITDRESATATAAADPGTTGSAGEQPSAAVAAAAAADDADKDKPWKRKVRKTSADMNQNQSPVAVDIVVSTGSNAEKGAAVTPSEGREMAGTTNNNESSVGLDDAQAATAEGASDPSRRRVRKTSAVDQEADEAALAAAAKAAAEAEAAEAAAAEEAAIAAAARAAEAEAAAAEAAAIAAAAAEEERQRQEDIERERSEQEELRKAKRRKELARRMAPPPVLELHAIEEATQKLRLNIYAAASKAFKALPNRPLSSFFKKGYSDGVDAQAEAEANAARLEFNNRQLRERDQAIRAEARRRARAVFTNIDHQMNGSPGTGLIEFDEWIQSLRAMRVETGGSIDRQGLHLIFDNFSEDGVNLKYNTWVERMGFGRTDAELLDLLKGALEDALGSDPRAAQKLEAHYALHGSRATTTALPTSLVLSEVDKKRKIWKLGPDGEVDYDAELKIRKRIAEASAPALAETQAARAPRGISGRPVVTSVSLPLHQQPHSLTAAAAVIAAVDDRDSDEPDEFFGAIEALGLGLSELETERLRAALDGLPGIEALHLGGSGGSSSSGNSSMTKLSEAVILRTIVQAGDSDDTDEADVKKVHRDGSRGDLNRDDDQETADDRDDHDGETSDGKRKGSNRPGSPLGAKMNRNSSARGGLDNNKVTVKKLPSASFVRTILSLLDRAAIISQTTNNGSRTDTTASATAKAVKRSPSAPTIAPSSQEEAPANTERTFPSPEGYLTRPGGDAVITEGLRSAEHLKKSFELSFKRCFALYEMRVREHSQSTLLPVEHGLIKKGNTHSAVLLPTSHSHSHSDSADSGSGSTHNSVEDLASNYLMSFLQHYGLLVDRSILRLEDDADEDGSSDQNAADQQDTFVILSRASLQAIAWRFGLHLTDGEAQRLFILLNARERPAVDPDGAPSTEFDHLDDVDINNLEGGIVGVDWIRDVTLFQLCSVPVPKQLQKARKASEDHQRSQREKRSEEAEARRLAEQQPKTIAVERPQLTLEGLRLHGFPLEGSSPTSPDVATAAAAVSDSNNDKDGSPGGEALSTAKPILEGEKTATSGEGAHGNGTEAGSTTDSTAATAVAVAAAAEGEVTKSPTDDKENDKKEKITPVPAPVPRKFFFHLSTYNTDTELPEGQRQSEWHQRVYASVDSDAGYFIGANESISLPLYTENSDPLLPAGDELSPTLQLRVELHESIDTNNNNTVTGDNKSESFKGRRSRARKPQPASAAAVDVDRHQSSTTRLLGVSELSLASLYGFLRQQQAGIKTDAPGIPFKRLDTTVASEGDVSTAAESPCQLELLQCGLTSVTVHVPAPAPVLAAAPEIASSEPLHENENEAAHDKAVAGDGRRGVKFHDGEETSKPASPKDTATNAQHDKAKKKVAEIGGGAGAVVQVRGPVERKIPLSEYVVDIVSALLFSHLDRSAYLDWLNSGEDKGDDDKLKGSNRKRLRLKASREGNQGGLRIPPQEEAAVRLQAAWRSKRVRRVNRRSQIAVVVIQRMMRGVLTRKRFQGSVQRFKDLQHQEKERIARLKRIREKERELALLRRIPVEDYLGMEKLRQENCARIVQRAWRKRLQKKFPRRFGKGSKAYDLRQQQQQQSGLLEKEKGGDGGAAFKGLVDAALRNGGRKMSGYLTEDEQKTAQQREEEEKFRKHNEKLYETIRSAIESYPDPSLRSQMAHKVEVDALGLAQIQRRIRDEAQRKLRLKAREQEKRYVSVGGSRARHNSEPLRFDPAETLRGPKAGAPGGGSSFFGDLSESDITGEGGVGGGGEHRERANFRPAAAVQAPERGNARRKYQELAEMQQLASVLIEEHLDSQDTRKRNQFDRLYSLGHVAHLAAQLKAPPTLDEARALFSITGSSGDRSRGAAQEKTGGLRVDTTGTGSRPGTAHNRGSHVPNLSTVPEDKSTASMFAQQWLAGLSTDGLEYAVGSHAQTVAALKDKSRWSLVAVPHDVTGPPVDITNIVEDGSEHLDASSTALRKRNRRIASASAWADGEGAAESLYWVAYATQPSKVNQPPAGTNLTGVSPVKAPPPSTASEANRRAAHAMLGEVDGQTLLTAVAKDYMSAGKRRAMVQKFCEDDNKRLNRLANMFTEEALFALRQKRAQSERQRLTAGDRSRRSEAVTNIQRVFRGKRSREIARALQSERRVVIALQTLLAELSKPELRAAGQSILGMDAALVHRLAGMKLAEGGSKLPQLGKNILPGAVRTSLNGALRSSLNASSTSSAGYSRSAAPIPSVVKSAAWASQPSAPGLTHAVPSSPMHGRAVPEIATAPQTAIPTSGRSHASSGAGSTVSEEPFQMLHSDSKGQIPTSDYLPNRAASKGEISHVGNPARQLYTPDGAKSILDLSLSASRDMHEHPGAKGSDTPSSPTSRLVAARRPVSRGGRNLEVGKGYQAGLYDNDDDDELEEEEQQETKSRLGYRSPRRGPVQETTTLTIETPHTPPRSSRFSTEGSVASAGSPKPVLSPHRGGRVASATTASSRAKIFGRESSGKASLLSPRSSSKSNYNRARTTEIDTPQLPGPLQAVATVDSHSVNSFLESYQSIHSSQRSSSDSFARARRPLSAKGAGAGTGTGVGSRNTGSGDRDDMLSPLQESMDDFFEDPGHRQLSSNSATVEFGDTRQSTASDGGYISSPSHSGALSHFSGSQSVNSMSQSQTSAAMAATLGGGKVSSSFATSSMLPPIDGHSSPAERGPRRNSTNTSTNNSVRGSVEGRTTSTRGSAIKDRLNVTAPASQFATPGTSLSFTGDDDEFGTEYDSGKVKPQQRLSQSLTPGVMASMSRGGGGESSAVKTPGGGVSVPRGSGEIGSVLSGTSGASAAAAAALVDVLPATPAATSAMDRVTVKYKSGNCDVSFWLTPALNADPANFNKEAALEPLQELCIYCGIGPLRRWLHRFRSTKANPNPSETPVDNRSAAVPKSSELEVEVAATLLAELHVELERIEGNGSDSSGSGLTREKQYRLIQMTILLRLLAGAADGRVRLSELISIVEDEWLTAVPQPAPQTGTKINTFITHVRSSLQQKAARESVSSADYFDRITGSVLASRTGDSALKTAPLDPAILLETADVASILGQCMAGSSATRGKAVRTDIAATVLRLSCWDQDAQYVRVGALRDYLCTLGSFRLLQQRLRLWFRAVPSMLNSLTNEAANRYTTGTTQRGAAATVLQPGDFCEAIRNSSVPICQAEAYMLAKLLSRDAGGGSLPANKRSNIESNVDLSLLRRISNGEILQAALSTY